MEGGMDKILQEIGWKGGFTLPVANNENRVLEKELESLLISKQKNTVKYDLILDKIKKLDKYCTHTHREHDQNEGIICMYKKQVEAETQEFKLKLAESEHVKSHTRKLEKEIGTTTERVSTITNKLAQDIKHLTSVRATASWDEVSLQAFDENIRKEDEDMEIIQKFSEIDQNKMKILDAKRETLQLEVIKIKDFIEKVDDECRTYEGYSNRAYQLLKKLKEERTSLIMQWQKAVGNIRQMENNAKKILENIDDIKEAIEKAKIKLEEQTAFLRREEDINNELDLELQEMSEYNAKMKRDAIYVTESLIFWNAECKSKKSLTQRNAYDLEKLQRDYKDTKKYILNRKKQTEVTRQEIITTRSKRDNVRSRKFTIAERLKQMNNEYDRALKLREKFEIKLEKLETHIATHQLQLHKTVTKLKEKQGDQLAKECTIDILKRRQKEHKRGFTIVKATWNRTSERECSLAIKVDTIEAGKQKPPRGIKRLLRRIARMKKKLVQLCEYTEYLEIRQTDIVMDVRENLLGYDDDVKDSTLTRNTHKTAKAFYDSGMKQVATAKSIYHHLQVDVMVLQLKCLRKEKLIKREGKKIYKGEQLGVLITAIIKDRKCALQTVKDIYKMKKKQIEGQRSCLKINIFSKNQKIEILKSRYDIAIGSLGKDEDGETMTLTQLNVKCFQEKFMVEAEYKKLIKKLKKTEEEVVAMENTYKVVNAANASVKHSLQPVQKDGKEEITLKKLKCAIKKKAEDIVDVKKIFLSEAEHLREVEKKLEQLREKIIEHHESIASGKITIEKMFVEAEERTDKLRFVDKQIEKIKRKITDAAKLKRFNKILQQRQIQDTNKESLQLLAQVGVESVEVEAAIKEHINAIGLELPKVRTSVHSNASASVRSPSTMSSTTSSSSSSINACNITNVRLRFEDEVVSKKKSK